MLRAVVDVVAAGWTGAKAMVDPERIAHVARVKWNFIFALFEWLTAYNNNDDTTVGSCPIGGIVMDRVGFSGRKDPNLMTDELR